MRRGSPSAGRYCVWRSSCVMAPDADRLLALAEAIADGRPLDWSGAQAATESDADRALVNELRLLANLADAHRTAGDADQTDAVAISELAQWGVLEIRERLGSVTFCTVYRAW